MRSYSPNATAVIPHTAIINDRLALIARCPVCDQECISGPSGVVRTCCVHFCEVVSEGGFLRFRFSL